MVVTIAKVQAVAGELRTVIEKLQELIDAKQEALDNEEGRDYPREARTDKLSEQCNILQEACDDMETAAEGLESYFITKPEGEMATLKLQCRKCGQVQTFRGETVDDIIPQVDAAGWGGKDDVCPKCGEESK
jgi:ribosomal protein S27AE